MGTRSISYHPPVGFERPNDVRPDGERAHSPICSAPFVAMEFDQFGDVQACCANALYPLGNVARQSIREIWDGERAVALRTALLRGDLSYGCGVCRHRLSHGYGELPRDYYDNFPLRSIHPDWPYSLQFSLHNTCNLECVMCGADRSSKIRSRRSHLEPLAHAYGDSFFEQLPPFLEHCGAADFSGGEPFLIAEHYRVWDLLAQLRDRPLCSLTTNGTVWNERVEGVLDALDLHISVSMDGITAPTLEAIRVGADFGTVMTNLERFRKYTSERGTRLTITWSLVRRNWFELGDMLRFAEERGIPVKVQTVIEPEFGVQRLPTDELRFVVDSLESEGRSLEPDLSINLAMWQREVQRLRDELADRERGGLRPVYMEPAAPENSSHVADIVVGAASPTPRDSTAGLFGKVTAALRTAVRRTNPPATTIDDARAELAEWARGGRVAELGLDTGGQVVSAQLEGLLPPGSALPPMVVGTPLAAVLDAIAGSIDGALWIGEEHIEPDRVLHTLWVGRPVRDKVGLVIRMISIPTPDGVLVLLAADDHLMPATTSTTPVTLGARRDRLAAG